MIPGVTPGMTPTPLTVERTRFTPGDQSFLDRIEARYKGETTWDSCRFYDCIVTGKNFLNCVFIGGMASVAPDDGTMEGCDFLPSLSLGGPSGRIDPLPPQPNGKRF